MTEVNKLRLRYMLADFITANIGFFIFDVARFFMVSASTRPATLPGFLGLGPLILEQFLVPMGILALNALFGAYNKNNTLFKSRLDETLSIAAVSLCAVFAVFFIALVNDNISERAANYELMASMWLCLFLPAYLLRMAMVSRNAARIRSGQNKFDVVVVGASPAVESRLGKILRSCGRTGMRVIACVDVDNALPAGEFCGVPVLRGDSLACVCREAGAQGLVLLPSALGLNRTARVINELFPLDIPIFVTPDLHSMLALRPRVSSVLGEPLVDITNPRISPAAENFKRLGDICVSAVALVLLLPVFIAIAVAVKLDSDGPVLYRQQRVGWHKKPFMINKFRTMRTDAEADGPALSSADDPRITRVGRTLRKYRLDELPQFWNVFVGEMSLVGPRPERDFYLRRMTERHPACSLIHRVRPGLTSWGMVKYGYASTVEQMLERLEYDLIYVENVSLAVDLKIMFYTVSTVVTGKGI